MRDSPPRSVIFVVSSSQQLETARAILGTSKAAAFDAVVFDAYTSAIVSDDAAPRARTTTLPLRSIARSAWTLSRLVRSKKSKRHGPPVVVVGQDFATTERAVIAAARRNGASIVLVPDGVVSAEPWKSKGGFQRSKIAIDRALVWARVLEGQRGRFGATQPDAICSWGDGWHHLWRAVAPHSWIVSTGSPRSAFLARLERPSTRRKLLVCSQDFSLFDENHLQTSVRWVALLNQLAERADKEDFELKIRLHPAEPPRPELSVGAQTRLSTETFEEDMTWSDCVVSPASTTLLEATSAGRSAAVVDLGFDDLLSTVPFFADERFPRLSPETLGTGPNPAALAGEHPPKGLAEDYLCDPGLAAERCAEVILGVNRRV